MIYITGDTHGQFEHVIKFCNRFELTEEDIVIIVGDVGLNYFLNSKDKKAKELLSKQKPIFMCVHGNHEERPEYINTYRQIINKYGTFYLEEEYPNILFMIDGNIYNILEKSFLCMGGAYSVDKYYRLENRWQWFNSEQMPEHIKEYIRNNYYGKSIDVILSHTCPYKYIPREMFLKGLDQSTIDNSMENFLDDCEDNIQYEKWICGHWHCNKTIDKLTFLFDEFINI